MDDQIPNDEPANEHEDGRCLAPLLTTLDTVVKVRSGEPVSAASVAKARAGRGEARRMLCAVRID
jgi:hypothetical protein